jgi:hypothetical protein
MSTESKSRTRLQNVVAAFLCVTGLVAVTVAATAAVPPVSPGPRAAVTGWTPPSMHEARAGEDVGPGSDEALLVSSPEAVRGR